MATEEKQRVVVPPVCAGRTALPRVEIEQRPLAAITAVGGGAGYAHNLLPVHLIAQEKIAALDLLAQVAEARGAADPAFIARRIESAPPRAEVFIKLPAAPRIDLENPGLQSLISTTRASRMAGMARS